MNFSMDKVFPRIRQRFQKSPRSPDTSVMTNVQTTPKEKFSLFLSMSVLQQPENLKTILTLFGKKDNCKIYLTETAVRHIPDEQTRHRLQYHSDTEVILSETISLNNSENDDILILLSEILFCLCNNHRKITVCTADKVSYEIFSCLAHLHTEIVQVLFFEDGVVHSFT